MNKYLEKIGFFGFKKTPEHPSLALQNSKLTGSNVDNLSKAPHPTNNINKDAQLKERMKDHAMDLFEAAIWKLDDLYPANHGHFDDADILKAMISDGSFYKGFENLKPEFLNFVEHEYFNISDNPFYKSAAIRKVPPGVYAKLQGSRLATAQSAKRSGQYSREFKNESKLIHDQKFGKKSPHYNKAPSSENLPNPGVTAFNSNLKRIAYGSAGVVGAGLVGNGIYQNTKTR